MNMGTDYLNLVPHLVEAGKFQDLVDAGQTLSSVLSPLDNSLAIYATNLASGIGMSQTQLSINARP